MDTISAFFIAVYVMQVVVVLIQVAKGYLRKKSQFLICISPFLILWVPLHIINEFKKLK